MPRFEINFGFAITGPNLRVAENLAVTGIDLYFQDPHEPLRLFKELEEENLFLIQNAHENVIVRLH